jgi:hypothetical protein
VRNLKGRTITVDVAANEPVVSVMAKIAEKEQIPIEIQRLIYAGKQLDPQMLLSGYGVARDATLNLAPCLIASRGNSSETESRERDRDEWWDYVAAANRQAIKR